ADRHGWPPRGRAPPHHRRSTGPAHREGGTMKPTLAETASLTDLPFDRLRQVMFDRLHGLPSIGPATDPRVDLEPFEWLSEEFRKGDAGLRDRMTAVLREFLGEITDLDVWPEDARDDLLDLIQDCGEDLIDDIRRLIRTRALFDLE